MSGGGFQCQLDTSGSPVWNDDNHIDSKIIVCCLEQREILCERFELDIQSPLNWDFMAIDT